MEGGRDRQNIIVINSLRFKRIRVDGEPSSCESLSYVPL